MISPLRSPASNPFLSMFPVAGAPTAAPVSSSATTSLAPLDAFEGSLSPAQDASAQPELADATSGLNQFVTQLVTALLSAVKSFFEGLMKKLTGGADKAEGKKASAVDGKKAKKAKRADKEERKTKADKKPKADKKKKADAPKTNGSYKGKGAEYLKPRGSHTVGQVHGLSAAEAFIIQHESGGNPKATNPSSGAFGIWQGLGATLTSEAKKFGFNPKTTNVNEQLIMFRDYVKGRYGTAEKAMAFWKAHNWY
jgi:hypothetical protein